MWNPISVTPVPRRPARSPKTRLQKRPLCFIMTCAPLLYWLLSTATRPRAFGPCGLGMLLSPDLLLVAIHYCKAILFVTISNAYLRLMYSTNAHSDHKCSLYAYDPSNHNEGGLHLGKQVNVLTSQTYNKN